MPKLFVAIAVPRATLGELKHIQPPQQAGIRLTDASQMHLTLHYLGDRDAEATTAALTLVAAPAFALTLDGVGQFPSAEGAVTLWAGVRRSPELLELHAAIAAALAGLGFEPEARPYVPHVTLARCEPGLASDAIDCFLKRNTDLSLSCGKIEEFGLYSSEFIDGAPVYRRERAFALQVAPDNADG